MDPEVTKIIVGIATPALAAAGLVAVALVNAWNKRERGPIPPVTATPAPSPGTVPMTETQQWTSFIQKLVNDAVAAATKPLQDKLDQYGERDKIVSRFVQRLYWWDESGRRGDMPRLTYEEQRVLDLDLVPENTIPPSGLPPRFPEPGERY